MELLQAVLKRVFNTAAFTGIPVVFGKFNVLKNLQDFGVTQMRDQFGAAKAVRSLGGPDEATNPAPQMGNKIRVDGLDGR